MKIPDDVRRGFEKNIGPIDRMSVTINEDGWYTVSDRVKMKYHLIDTKNVVEDLNYRMGLYVSGYKEAMARVKEKLAQMKSTGV